VCAYGVPTRTISESLAAASARAAVASMAMSSPAAASSSSHSGKGKRRKRPPVPLSLEDELAMAPSSTRSALTRIDAQVKNNTRKIEKIEKDQLTARKKNSDGMVLEMLEFDENAPHTIVTCSEMSVNIIAADIRLILSHANIRCVTYTLIHIHTLSTPPSRPPFHHAHHSISSSLTFFSLFLSLYLSRFVMLVLS
jgi:hypothetical protein